MSKKKNEELLRTRLSLSQQDFAEYLGVTRSQLTMYEQGLRSLPTPAFLKLANLEMIHHNFLQENNNKYKHAFQHAQTEKQNEKAKKEAGDHIAFCDAKKNILQKKLKEKIDEYSKAETWSRLLDEMLLDIPDDKEENREYSWLVSQKNGFLKKLSGMEFYRR